MGGVLHEGWRSTKITEQPNNKQQKKQEKTNNHITNTKIFQARSVHKGHTMQINKIDKTTNNIRIDDTRSNQTKTVSTAALNCAGFV